ncbi:MAG: SIMPL domain-containing protein [Pseudoxanthomonas suwonensis]|nr:SIMPL domain-containing protein [Pseudoxanthomonas suwonensis]
MTRPTLFPMLRPLAVTAALLLGTAAMTASAQSPTPIAAPDGGTWVSVSASAETTRVPDVATMSAGVVTQGADANAAMRANATEMAKVMAAIRAAGIAERDVQTSGISVHPQYRHSNEEAPKITGYNARNTVNIRVRDVARLGQVLDALVTSGANQVDGPNFEVDEPEAAYDEARLAALDKARARADLYARALGVKVRRVVSISESGSSAPRPPMMMRAMVASDAIAETSVSPGETTLRANLEVVFELGR